MASLALGLVGAGAGYMIGGPTGAQIGFLVGSYLGGYLEEKPNVEGPRLNDRAVQASTYGIPLPIVRGTARIAGNIIWAEELREVPVESEAGGKGGPSQTQTTYTYYGTFAVSLCNNAISAIRRIWADGNLIYDASDGNSGPVGLGPNPAFFEAIVDSAVDLSDVALPMIVYLGTESQMPDPTMEAYLGAGNVPAYRGQAYVVFTDLALDRYGNRIPNLSFEVVESGAVADQVTRYTAPTGMRLKAVYNPLLNEAWIQMAQTSNSDPYLVRLNADTGALVGYVYPQVATEHYAWNGDPVYDPVEQRVYVSTETSIGQGHYMVIDAASGVEVQFSSPASVGVLALKLRTDPTTGERISELWGYRTSVAVLRLLEKSDGTVVRTVSVPFNYLAEMVFDDVHARGWLRRYTDVNNELYVLDEFGMEVTLAYTHPTSIDKLAYDSVRNILWFPTNGSATVQGYDVIEQALSPQTITLARQPLHFVYDPQRDLVEGTNDTFSGGYFFANHVSTGAQFKDIHENYSSTSILPARNAVLAIGGGASGVTDHSLVKIRFDVVSVGSVVLSEVVENICIRAGLEADDVDVTELTDEVLGYVMGRQNAARECVQQLAIGYLFDGVESDDRLKFHKRGRLSAITIPEDDLAAHQAGGGAPDVISQTRRQDIELPAKLNVVYSALALDYAQGTQYAERLAGATPTSAQLMTIEAPIVFHDDTAKQLADALMFCTWTDRTRYQFATDLSYAEYEPTDVLTITDRVLRVTHKEEVGGLIHWEGVADDAAIYAQDAAGVSAIRDEQVIPSLVPSFFTPLDTVLLRDVDDAPGFYAALGGYQSGWNGAVLYKSSDAGATYDAMRAVDNASVEGIAVNALGDFEGGNVFDELNVLTVSLWAGATLSSASRLAVLNGANMAALQASNGWEILQFREATLNANGTATLRGLLRGRRGSEYAMGAHAGGNAFVLLSVATTQNLPHDSAEIGLSRLYKAVTIGDYLPNVSPQAFTSQAVRLKPLAPVLVGGGRNAAGDLTINWRRRTRVGGEWRDGVEVALGEDSELYEVEVYDSSYTTLVCTFTLLTAPTVTYTAADQTTDFGSPQATVYVKVYQVSATVGRGFAATASV